MDKSKLGYSIVELGGYFANQILFTWRFILLELPTRSELDSFIP